MRTLSAEMRRIKKQYSKLQLVLEHLTKQLNEFRPVNVEHVGDAQKQVTEQFEQRLNLQSTRIDVVTESVQKAQKVAEGKCRIPSELACGC